MDLWLKQPQKVSQQTENVMYDRLLKLWNQLWYLPQHVWDGNIGLYSDYKHIRFAYKTDFGNVCLTLISHNKQDCIGLLYDNIGNGYPLPLTCENDRCASSDNAENLFDMSVTPNDIYVYPQLSNSFNAHNIDLAIYEAEQKVIPLLEGHEFHKNQLYLLKIGV